MRKLLTPTRRVTSPRHRVTALQELADHPWKVGDNGKRWKWDLDGDRYVDTGILAKGGVLYPTFTINPADMTLVMSYEDEVSPNLVKLNQETGELYLNV